MGPARALLLVVEDDPDLRAALAESLALEGYRVEAACDGQEAIDWLAAGMTPDLILADVMMPNVDGFELLRRIRDNPKWMSIPFLFLTSRTDRRDVLQGKSLGAEDYVSKPFSYDELLPLIEARIERARALASRQSAEVDDMRQGILRLLNHEFRTPLTSIVAYSNLLNDVRQRGSVVADLDDTLRHIGGGAHRLRRLIGNFVLLMDLGYPDVKNEVAAQRMQRIDDPERMLHDAVAAVERATDGHRFRVQAESTAAGFRCDRELLLIALRELIDNAVKFSPAGSTITLLAQRCGPDVKLAVSDEGRGVAAAEFDRLPDAFYQASRPAHEQQGSGIGLTLVKAIADAHKGRLEIESAVGKGSRFTLVLPANWPKTPPR
ncbi:MAG: response regulator [Chloroflexi bacterium]|nr:response regulator [Chloroflexota bacterium]